MGELPGRTQSARKASVIASASALSMRLLRTRSTSPERVWWVVFHSSMPANADSG
tara:strand:- start:52 stop:216 length:165 start_codon:yes stop_codon:yes gene_type:complete